MAEFGQWRYTVDRTATLEAYARQTAGGAATCTCTGCRNFVVARDQIFPARFVEFLNTIGIDSTKDAEVYHAARMRRGVTTMAAGITLSERSTPPVISRPSTSAMD